MKDTLNHLFAYRTLPQEEAHRVVLGIARNQYPPAQVAAFLTVYLMRSVTVAELAGFRNALLELCQPADLGGYDVMDVCGTGGDGRNTFNISTLAAFVVAGAGQPVAKHGNHGVSSISGSSTVLEFLGLRFTADSGQLQRQLDAAGICFLHAPLFHPALRNVGPLRKELGVKTFFNMLGPLVNPARPRTQLMGVFSLELARLYAYLLQPEAGREFLIVHSLDGYDEVSLTGPVRLIGNHREELLTPADFDLPATTPEALFGGDTVAEAAQIFLQVLRSEAPAAHRHAVLANAALALRTAGRAANIADGLAQAAESLDSGRARQAFERLLALD
ncbi:MAG: anthranilate phosphoribosyltransferase [Janthinobacterium lividum]